MTFSVINQYFQPPRLQAEPRDINRLQVIPCMSPEKLLRSANCPVNFKAEHHWVDAHVVETLPFLHIQHKHEFFANEFHDLVAVGNNIISPTL